MSIAVRKSKKTEMKQLPKQSEQYARATAGHSGQVKSHRLASSGRVSTGSPEFASNMRFPFDIAGMYKEKTRGLSQVVRREYATSLLKAVQEIAEKEGLRFVRADETVRTPVKVVNQIPDANRKFLEKMAIQSNAARERDLAEGRLIPAGKVWEKLEITKQAVSKAVKEKRMFTLDGPSGESLYPAFYTDKRYDRRTLGKISKALGDLPGPSKWQFFTTGKASLGGKTPLDALSNGEVDAVLVTAAGFVER